MRNTIFISHRTVDEKVADMIKDFLVATGVPNDNIFCSSLPGNDVEERISPEVKRHLKNATIIILILSKDYYQSAYCINEAGVAWYLDDEILSIPFGLPEITHDKMLGFINSDYKLRSLDNYDDISYLFDKALERLGVHDVTHSIITRESEKLRERYNNYISCRKIDDLESDIEDDSVIVNEKKYISNQIVKIINDAGGEISGIKSIADELGVSEYIAKKKLQIAIEDGSIEKVGAGRFSVYRVKQLVHSPVVGEDDVGFIPPDSALLLVYAANDEGQIIKEQTQSSSVKVSTAHRKFMVDDSKRESARYNGTVN